MLRWISRLAYLDARIDDARTAAPPGDRRPRAASRPGWSWRSPTRTWRTWRRSTSTSSPRCPGASARSRSATELETQQLPIDVLPDDGHRRGARRPGRRPPRAQPRAGARGRDRRLRRPRLRSARASPRCGGGTGLRPSAGSTRASATRPNAISTAGGCTCSAGEPRPRSSEAVGMRRPPMPRPSCAIRTRA